MPAKDILWVIHIPTCGFSMFYSIPPRKFFNGASIRSMAVFFVQILIFYSCIVLPFSAVYSSISDNVVKSHTR